MNACHLSIVSAMTDYTFQGQKLQDSSIVRYTASPRTHGMVKQKMIISTKGSIPLLTVFIMMELRAGCKKWLITVAHLN